GPRRVAGCNARRPQPGGLRAEVHVLVDARDWPISGCVDQARESRDRVARNRSLFSYERGTDHSGGAGARDRRLAAGRGSRQSRAGRRGVRNADRAGHLPVGHARRSSYTPATVIAGTRLGPYEIVSALGAGGMGEVYLARDTRLGRDVAVKVMRADLTDSPQARERFQREARAVAALQHPNICTIHDVGETSDGKAFLVMELLQGETLEQRLARGPIEARQVVAIGTALTGALDAAHKAGFVHRDIKPANILLTAHGPKILDFGLAKAAAPVAATAAQPTQAVRPHLTEPGGIVGTVAYMSPEQLRGEDLDARTDLFSLGVVLRETAPAAPKPLADIIEKGTEPDRALRYQHASDMHTDLLRLQRDAASPARAAFRRRAM